MQDKTRFLQRIWTRFMALTEEYKLPLITGFVFGLAANLYAFTNKFVNADELEYLFSKGATLSSGRWQASCSRTSPCRGYTASSPS